MKGSHAIPLEKDSALFILDGWRTLKEDNEIKERTIENDKTG